MVNFSFFQDITVKTTTFHKSIKFCRKRNICTYNNTAIFTNSHSILLQSRYEYIGTFVHTHIVCLITELLNTFNAVKKPTNPQKWNTVNT